MASFFDVSLVGHFSTVFIILFIFTAVYAVLTFKQPFGSNSGLNALLAATLALMFLFVEQAQAVIRSSVPWFVVMMIGLMFVLMVTGSIGASISDTLMRTIGTWVFIISIFILILNISLQYGQSVGPHLEGNTSTTTSSGEGFDVATNSFSQNLGATIFHPKVLALIVVILVSTFAVLWIGYGVTPPI